MHFQIFFDRVLIDICIWQFSDRILTHLWLISDRFLQLIVFWQISDRYLTVFCNFLYLHWWQVPTYFWGILIRTWRGWWKTAQSKCSSGETGRKVSVGLPLFLPSSLAGWREMICSVRKICGWISNIFTRFQNQASKLIVVGFYTIERKVFR